MTRRAYVPPRLETPGIAVQVVRHKVARIDGLLDAVAKVKEALDAPVQVVRSDRVVSFMHLVAAAHHAQRAVVDGRMRASDPAVEFLLYAACDRQIHRAVEALGVRPDETAELVVVALDPVRPETMGAALVDAGLPSGTPWGRADAPRDMATSEAAQDWWRARLDVGGPATVEGALLARMALLALDRA